MWTDSKYALDKRHTFGIYWEELPAIAVNGVQRLDFTYPRRAPLKKENIINWLGETSKMKLDEVAS